MSANILEYPYKTCAGKDIAYMIYDTSYKSFSVKLLQ